MIKFENNDHNSKINNNFNVKNTQIMNKKGKQMSELKELIRKVIDEAEFKMTDVGPFSVVVEQKNGNPFKYLSSYGVIIKPDSAEDKAPRIVRFFAKNQSETYEHESANKIKGSREDVLEYLKFGDFAQDFEDYIDTISSKFYLDDNI